MQVWQVTVFWVCICKCIWANLEDYISQLEGLACTIRSRQSRSVWVPYHMFACRSPSETNPDFQESGLPVEPFQSLNKIRKKIIQQTLILSIVFYLHEPKMIMKRLLRIDSGRTSGSFPLLISAQRWWHNLAWSSVRSALSLPEDGMTLSKGRRVKNWA